MEIGQFILEPSLELPRVGQLGFIVHDVQVSRPSFASAFNLKTWYEPQYSERKFKVGSEMIELDFNLTFAYSGKQQIELVEEKSQSAATFRNYLETNGPGLHHLGFYIPDLETKLKLVEKLGLDILLEGQFTTAGGGNTRFVYLDTRPQCGIIIELINIKLHGINVPQTEFMMNVGRITGDVLRIDI